MTQASDIAAEISAKLPAVKGGSLVVWGDIFGGRIDNWHTITSAVAPAEDQVSIRFNHGETLDVWDPGIATIGERDFRIATAAKVRWEWFYYGRAELAENRFFIEHAVVDGIVVASSDAKWAPNRFRPHIARAAVELMGFD
ncbi:MAG: hypothetical protein JWN61_2235 [Pseudonocardiales bacterium]|nr:hypothetical protein [Pseudonocardiales bacterium]